MKVHDLSLTLRPDMVTWPGEPAPRIEPLKRIAQGDSNNVSIITLGDHTGTHVDPPLHFIEGGNTVDKLPIDALVGPCRVVAFPESGHVSSGWLTRLALVMLVAVSAVGLLGTVTAIGMVDYFAGDLPTESGSWALTTFP